VLDRAVLVTAAAIGYAAVSLVRHHRVETAAYDLGIFTQAVKAYSRLRAPVVPLKGPGVNLLGDHFHPIVALLAPMYRLAPHAVTLLAAQALLVAASAWPLHSIAAERLGRGPAAAVTIAYLLSFGLQGLIVFDFHEVAFAVPLLAAVCADLLRERWRAACLASLPLLLVKEDLFATVAAVGVLLLCRRQRRLGAGLLGVAVLVGATVLLVVVPALSGSGHYRYWANLSPDPGGPSLLDTLVSPQKVVTLALLLGVTGFLAVGSPLLVLALPTLAWRFLTDNPVYWGTGAHYDAVLMPVLFTAAVDTLSRLGRTSALRRAWVTRPTRTAPAVMLGLALAALPWSRFAAVAEGDTPVVQRRAAAAAEMVRRVPDGAVVSASNNVAGQLVDRCTVILFPNTSAALRPEYVLVDTARLSGVPLPESPQREYLERLRSGADGFVLTAQRDEFQLFRRAGW
jgi:uncharacterized membrane protein